MNNRTFKFILFFLVWIGAAALALTLVGTLFGFTISAPVGLISPLSVLLFVPMLARTARAVRKRQALAITTYIEQAVRLGMPIQRMLDAAAAGEHRKVAIRMRDLGELLDSGAPLDAALEDAVPEVSPRAVGRIAAAQRNGNLPEALSRLVQEGRREAPLDTTAPAFFTAYPIMMTVFISVILSMIVIFVIPKYEQIFKDFGTKLPMATQSMLVFVANAGPAMALAVAVIGLALLGRALWEVFRPFGPGVRPGEIVGFWLLSTIPPARGAIRNRDLADVFEVLADATESGLPIDGALAEATNLHTSHMTRTMLARWSESLRAGISLVDSARSAGAPDLCVGLLATAQASADIPSAFRFLSRYYRDKFSRTLIMLRAAFIPLMVILFAIPVLWVCLSLFAPLVSLIGTVSSPSLHTPWRRL